MRDLESICRRFRWLRRTAFHRLFAEGHFGFVLWLFENVRMTAVVVAGKISRRRFAAEIAVNALIIDIKRPVDVFRISIGKFGHMQKE